MKNNIYLRVEVVDLKKPIGQQVYTRMVLCIGDVDCDIVIAAVKQLERDLRYIPLELAVDNP